MCNFSILFLFLFRSEYDADESGGDDVVDANAVDDELIITLNGYEIRQSNLSKLIKNDRLDDQIINVYLAIVAERNNRTPGLPSVCAVDSLLSQMVESGNYAACDILNYDAFDLI